MQTEKLLRQIEFIKEIDKLKYIQRKTRLINSDRHENDAEHSWHLAMMVLIMAEHANESFDILKVLKMVLIHDLVEIDAGDTFLFDSTKDHVNTEEELKAASRIFGILPAQQAEELIAIWQEFEHGKTPEARFAKAMDRFEPVLQNTSNGGGTWAEHNLSYDRVIKKIGSIKNGSESIWDYTKGLMEDCKTKGVFNQACEKA